MEHRLIASAEQDAQLAEHIISKEVVFPGAIIRLEHWQVRLPNGDVKLREVACHPGAAAVIAVDGEGQIIMVRQQRIAVDRLTWEIPAGKLDSAQEDPLDCAKRELSEETGLSAAHWQKLTCMETTPGFCNERIHLYLATGLQQGATHPDEDEFVATSRLPLRDAVQCVMDGTFRDGKTCLGILMAAQALSCSN